MTSPDTGARTRIDAVRASLMATTAPKSGQEQLDGLRRYLSTLPPEAAAAAIVQFLDSKQDALSDLGFAVDADGFLRTAPSLRVFLLDYLLRVDRQAAGRYAESILATMDSPDEWAISLRNFALASSIPDARTFLERKTKELLQYEPWQSNPSTGYLEAFDVAVHLGGTNLMPSLTQLVRQQDNSAVAHAAYLALDRLAISDPAVTLDHLLRGPDSMQGREQTRANYFARANVSDPRQREILENYLLVPDLSATELQTFAGLFPNANFMISHNLLTQTAPPDGATLAARDAAALRVVQEWLTDPRFAGRRAHLEGVKRRLEGFVGPAGNTR